MGQKGTKWTTVLAEAGCYGFLEPVASRAVSAALDLCPEGALLASAAARNDLRDICQRRLGTVYERPLIQLAVKRISFVGSLALGAEGEAQAQVMRNAAENVRDNLAADAGASLRARLPFAADYERAIADSFSKATAEFLGRLLLARDDISRELLGGRPVTRIEGVSARGADPHRHGRTVMRVDTDAGTFYYKPHDCRLDVLYAELVGAWFADCARAAKIVPCDGYAFVERLVPEELAKEGELRAYWRNLGCLTALFHGLGSRDMTQDNIMCCGVRPAALDLETLLTGELGFRKSPLEGNGSAFAKRIGLENVPGEALADSVVCTAVLPLSMEGPALSPLTTDNAGGTCLPRVAGERRTVKGFEQDFAEGFEEGYRRLVRHRDEVLAVLGRYGDATCRQILLNTWAYGQARARLFSPGAMSDPGRRDEVLMDLNAAYGVFSPKVQQGVAGPDEAALTEGDIPYYCSRAGSRTLFAGEGMVVGDFLERSALEVATYRLGRLSEDDMQFELDLIRRCLAADPDLKTAGYGSGPFEEGCNR